MNKNLIIILLVIVLVFASGIFVYAKYFQGQGSQNQLPTVSNYDECVAAGYVVQESYPPTCVTKDGKSFTQDIGNELEKTDLITIDSPRPNAVISSPLIITGKARGTWFFEASFPVKLYDQNNQIIARGIAQAQGEWMTDEFVNYKAILKFTAPESQKGSLILEKDNPSDLRENDDQLIVPVLFK
jgi:hypothetical protein